MRSAEEVKLTRLIGKVTVTFCVLSPLILTSARTVCFWGAVTPVTRKLHRWG